VNLQTTPTFTAGYTRKHRDGCIALVKPQTQAAFKI